MTDASYDVFISYRRESGSAEARLIRNELMTRGLRVFMDVTELKKGYFDDALLHYISATPNFLLILSPHALDHCDQAEDWLRQEIVQAISTGRNVIPVLLKGFTFPSSIDPSIKTLPRHQGVEYSHTFFEAMVDRIVQSVEADRAERQRSTQTRINIEQVTKETAETERAAREKYEREVLAREKLESERLAKVKFETEPHARRSFGQQIADNQELKASRAGIGPKGKLLLSAVIVGIGLFLLICIILPQFPTGILQKYNQSGMWSANLKPVYQVNCGGQAVGSFSADKYFSGGGVYGTSDGIATANVSDPPPDEVYQSERYGNMAYHFPELTPGAQYVVRLHFADLDLGKEAVGARVFNVFINSKEVLHHFDILAETKAKNRAIAKTFTVTADDDGRISIVFESVTDTYYATISAIEILQSENSGPSSGTTVPAIAPTQKVKPIYRVNCGGQAVGSFSADKYFSGGGVYGTSDGIATANVPDPPPDEVYQSERYGNMAYHFPELTPGAQYVVRLHFADLDLGKEAVGARVFNVFINSKEVLHHFDILAETKAKNRAIAKTFTVTADDDGRISIVFESVTDTYYATISAIEILQSENSGPSSGTTVPAIAPTQKVKPIYRVNCGGQAVGSFSADKYFSGGGVYGTSDGIATANVPDPPPDEVYQSERYGNMAYHFPELTPGAQYVVRLHFADLDLGKEAVGARVFNVFINSKEVLHHFDILAETKAKNRAIAKTFTVTADDDGRISIVFESVTDTYYATISAIEILQSPGP